MLNLTGTSSLAGCLTTFPEPIPKCRTCRNLESCQTVCCVLVTLMKIMVWDSETMETIIYPTYSMSFSRIDVSFQCFEQFWRGCMSWTRRALTKLWSRGCWGKKQKTRLLACKCRCQDTVLLGREILSLKCIIDAAVVCACSNYSQQEEEDSDLDAELSEIKSMDEENKGIYVLWFGSNDYPGVTISLCFHLFCCVSRLGTARSLWFWLSRRPRDERL